MNKKQLKQGLGLMAILLLLVLLSASNKAIGNPFSQWVATKCIKNYAAEEYPVLNLETSKAMYNFKYGEYRAQARSKDSPDTHFFIYYDQGKIKDNYTGLVLSRWNTALRLNEEFGLLVEPLLAKNMRYDFKSITAGLDKKGEYATGVLDSDLALDLYDLPLEAFVSLYIYTDYLSWDAIAQITLEADAILRAQHLAVKQYTVVLQPRLADGEKSTVSLGVYDFPQSELSQPDLAQVMANFMVDPHRERLKWGPLADLHPLTTPSQKPMD